MIYVVAAAAAILLIDRAPQGAEHLKQILTGNILTSGIAMLDVIVPLYARSASLHWLLRARLRAGADSLRGSSCSMRRFGVVVTSSVALAGVLLVFSFLIIPAAIGVLYRGHVGATARDRLDRRRADQRRRAGGLVRVRSADRCRDGLHLRCRAGAGRRCSIRYCRRSRGLRVRGAPTRAALVRRRLLAGSALVADGGAARRPAAPRRCRIRARRRCARSISPRSKRRPTTTPPLRGALPLEAERLNELETRSRSKGEALDDVQCGGSRRS